MSLTNFHPLWDKILSQNLQALADQGCHLEGSSLYRGGLLYIEFMKFYFLQNTVGSMPTPYSVSDRHTGPDDLRKLQDLTRSECHLPISSSQSSIHSVQSKGQQVQRVGGAGVGGPEEEPSEEGRQPCVADQIGGPQQNLLPQEKYEGSFCSGSSVSKFTRIFSHEICLKKLSLKA
jgi:hypothetical protein